MRAEEARIRAKENRDNCKCKDYSDPSDYLAYIKLLIQIAVNQGLEAICTNFVKLSGEGYYMTPIGAMIAEPAFFKLADELKAQGYSFDMAGTTIYVSWRYEPLIESKARIADTKIWDAMEINKEMNIAQVKEFWNRLKQAGTPL